MADKELKNKINGIIMPIFCNNENSVKLAYENRYGEIRPVFVRFEKVDDGKILVWFKFPLRLDSNYYGRVANSPNDIAEVIFNAIFLASSSFVDVFHAKTIFEDL